MSDSVRCQCHAEMVRTGECWTCPNCGAFRKLERTWVGIGCDHCGEEVPIVAAIVGGAPIYRNPNMRLPLFTRGQLAEVDRILAEGIDCLRCSATLEPEHRLVIWVPPPADLEALRFA